MDHHAPRPTFNDALRQAMVRRGLPLSRVQARLAASGHRVAVSTLSQWQGGHRLPRSEESLAVVAALETVLDVPAGSLTRLAVEQSPSAAASRPVVSYASAFQGLVDRLGVSTYGALATLGVHDRIRIGADGALDRRRTVTTIRATSPTDRHVIAHSVDPGGDASLATVQARGGCRLGRVERDLEAGVVAAELHFDRRLAPGETVVHDVVVLDRNVARADFYYRWTTAEIALHVLEVSFDPRRLPTRLEGFSRARTEAPDEISEELTLGPGHRAHLVRQPATPGVHGIRWTWPEP